MAVKQADVRNQEEGGVHDASEIFAGVGAAFTGEKTGVGMGIQRPCRVRGYKGIPLLVRQLGTVAGSWGLVAQISIWDFLTCT